MARDTVPALRWSCPTCGRFIAESAVKSGDNLDPTAYYGVTSWVTGECSRCGVVEDPLLVEVVPASNREGA